MEFHKNLSLTGWDEVKKRQLQRMPLVDEWIALLQLREGHSVLDIGPGPGMFTLRYAEAVGASGRVTALEKDRDAADYLAEQLSSSDRNIKLIVDDAETADFGDIGSFDVIMLTDILHHTDSPAKVLRNLYRSKGRKETHIFISEFDPAASGEMGPPVDKRLSEQYIREILGDIGFTIKSAGKQAFEHYYVIAGF